MAGLRTQNWNGSSWIRRERRLAIYIRDNFTCVHCDKDLLDVPPRMRTLDHIVPPSKGGTNETKNLITSCEHCNKSRGDTPIQDFQNEDRLQRITFILSQPIDLGAAKQIINNKRKQS